MSTVPRFVIRQVSTNKKRSLWHGSERCVRDARLMSLMLPFNQHAQLKNGIVKENSIIWPKSFFIWMTYYSSSIFCYITLLTGIHKSILMLQNNHCMKWDEDIFNRERCSYNKLFRKIDRNSKPKKELTLLTSHILRSLLYLRLERKKEIKINMRLFAAWTNTFNAYISNSFTCKILIKQW